MPPTRVWAKGLGLGLAGPVVEGVDGEAERATVVVRVRPVWHERHRCGICRQRCPGFDAGAGRRWQRALDLGTTVTVLEADSPRVQCQAPTGW